MNMTRRDAVKIVALSSAAVMVGAMRGVGEDAMPIVGFTLPPLPYGYDALEPYIDVETMRIHHDKHHQAYVDNLNKAVSGHPEMAGRTVEDLLRNLAEVPEAIRGAVRNHGGGHANHTLFWASLGGAVGVAPAGAFGEAIGSSFGGFEAMQAQLVAAGKGVFGSGWAWLCMDGERKLAISTTANQDSPLTSGATPLLGLDVWEHAYYLRYQNRRPEYLEAILKVVDWNGVAGRYEGAVGG